MKLPALIIFFFVFFLISCKKNEDFSIDTITVPTYFKEYDVANYYKLTGPSAYILTKRSCNKMWKDSGNRNFLTVQEMDSGFPLLPKDLRMTIFKGEYKATPDFINSKIEVYHSERIDSLKEPIEYIYSTYYILKENRIFFEIVYKTLDKDAPKRTDYEKIAMDVKVKCQKGVEFASCFDNEKREKVIIK